MAALTRLLLEYLQQGALRHLTGVVRVDVERPGQVGGRPVQLLVDEVPEPADGLGQRDVDRDVVQVLQHVDFRDPGIDDDRQDPANQSAVDAQSPEAPGPEIDDVHRVFAVVGPAAAVRRRTEHVVDPRAQDAGNQAPGQQVPDVVRIPARTLGPQGA